MYSILRKSICLLLIVSLLPSCATLWGDADSSGDNSIHPESNLSTTGKGAAAGGLIGAAVGTLIGSTSGNAGEGLVLGTLAGAATGGAVGKTLEEGENTYETQEQKIEKQSEEIRKQRIEIEALRRKLEDKNSYDPTYTDNGYDNQLNQNLGLGSYQNSNSETFDNGTDIDLGENDNFDSEQVVESEVSLNNAQARINTTQEDEYIGSSGRQYLQLPSARSSKAQQLKIKTKPLRESYELAAKEVDSTPKRVKMTAKKEVRKPSFKPKEIKKQKPLKVIKKVEKTKTVVKQVREENELGSSAKTARVFAKKKFNNTNSKPVQEVKSSVEKKAAEEVSTIDQVIETNTPKEAKIAPTNTTCVRGKKEADKALKATSAADRLFYYRRALRFCPEVASYHVEIGKIYSSIGRIEDAKTEFEKALDINPALSEARDGLADL